MKTFRIVKTDYVYSKKKGAHPKQYTLTKGLSLEEAEIYVKTVFPSAKKVSDKEWKIPGMLYSGSIVCK